MRDLVSMYDLKFQGSNYHGGLAQQPFQSKLRYSDAGPLALMALVLLKPARRLALFFSGSCLLCCAADCSHLFMWRAFSPDCRLLERCAGKGVTGAQSPSSSHPFHVQKMGRCCARHASKLKEGRSSSLR